MKEEITTEEVSLAVWEIPAPCTEHVIGEDLVEDVLL